MPVGLLAALWATGAVDLRFGGLNVQDADPVCGVEAVGDGHEPGKIQNVRTVRAHGYHYRQPRPALSVAWGTGLTSRRSKQAVSSPLGVLHPHIVNWTETAVNTCS